MFHKSTIITFANNIKWFYDMLDELSIYLKKYERFLHNVKCNNYNKSNVKITPIDMTSNNYIVDISVNKSEFKFIKDSKLTFDVSYKTARSIIDVNNSKEIELSNNYYLNKKFHELYELVWSNLFPSSDFEFLGIDNSTDFTILRFRTIIK